jgi:hypothetical protein
MPASQPSAASLSTLNSSAAASTGIGGFDSAQVLRLGFRDVDFPRGEGLRLAGHDGPKNRELFSLLHYQSIVV